MPDSLVASHPDIAPLLNFRPQRARLLEAMVRAVAEKGYEQATVADAVRLARVSRGTFYELFESKEACLLAAYRVGNEVLEERIDVAIRDAGDWRDEMRLGLRAYLLALDQDPVFARVSLIEASVVWSERDAVLRRFAARYGKTFAKSGRPVPPDEALYLLAVGVHELACSRVRAGEGVLGLEDILVGCAVRLVCKEESWT
ncbi:MAG TPA: TetR/AcrR family transcriptional regulator [Solirubrobacteraceae bacterium]